MKKHLLIILIAIFVAATCALCVTACRGEPGADGANIVGAYVDDGELYLILSSGACLSCGQVSGTDGIDGIDGLDGLNGVGISKIETDNDGNLIITFANGVKTTVEVAPKVCTHEYGDWIVKTEADCVTPGYKYHVCSLCGYVEHEITNAWGHDWDHDHTDAFVTPDICTDEGWQIVTCSTCGETKMEKIEAHSHHYTEVTYSYGHEVHYCRDCGMWEPSEGLVISRSGVLGEYTLTSLGDCADDEYVVIPDVVETADGYKPVTKIASKVFANNSNIKGVYLSKNISNIDCSGGMFANSVNISEIVVQQQNPVYRSDGNCIVDMYNRTVVAGCAKSSIPSDGSVTTIGESAFYAVTGLTKLILPEKIVTLGSFAFGGCIGLTELNLGGTNSMLNEIGYRSFYYCTGLKTLKIVNVPIIGESAFDSCFNLEEAYIDKGCLYIMSNAFAACTSLTTVHIASTIISIKSYGFGACPALSDIYYEGTSSSWSLLIDKLWITTPPLYTNTYEKTTITDSGIHYGQY